ncbi:MAG TPA: hypothetical protein VGG19_00025 [Tepidisphaeraceae bacterium]|jgi:hypothetical protein
MKNQSPKPGSSFDDAKKMGGKGDFGAAESNVIERNYTSVNTKRSDPGGAKPRGGSMNRETGVGANASGPGSASGGDVDTDIVGIGSGRGMSQNGPDKDYHGGPDEAQQTSGQKQVKPAPHQDLNTPGKRQSTIFSSPENIENSSQGADAVTNPNARRDDSFAAEVSSDEASGRNDR